MLFVSYSAVFVAACAVTCYVSYDNFPRQVSWRLERAKASAFVSIPAPDATAESVINRTAKFRSVRSDAFDILSDDQRQTIWKHVEHLTTELFDRDRVRREQRRRTDSEYRKHLLSLKMALVDRKMATKPQNAGSTNTTDTRLSESQLSGIEYPQAEIDQTYVIDQGSLNDLTEFGMTNNRPDDDVVNVLDLDDLGQPIQRTRPSSLPHEIDHQGQVGSYLEQLDVVDDHLSAAASRRGIHAASRDGRGFGSDVRGIVSENVGRREQMQGAVSPLGEHGYPINGKTKRRTRRNSETGVYVSDRKNKIKSKRMARLDDDDLEEAKAVKLEKLRLVKMAEKPEVMHPGVHSDDSGELPDTFSRRMLFDQIYLTMIVFACSLLAVWICVPFSAIATSPVKLGIFKQYLKYGKFWDTMQCRDSTYRPMAHAFRFLDIQPPSYNQYMTLKESLGYHSNASLNMVHYAQLAAEHL